MKFTDLGLVEPITRAVAAEGYTTPTPIQRQAIPEAMAGKDVLGCAQTGTGKTGAFALPILHRLARPTGENGQRVQTAKKTKNSKHSRKGRNSRHQESNHSSGKPRALILCPTRELASQILDSFNTYGRNLPLRHTVVYGGVSQFRQVKQLRAGIDVLVATPGRLLDLINQGYIDLRAVETLVLDEADRMLDMGFIPDIRKIVECMPTKRQTLLFSATMPNDIRKLADSVLIDPVSVEVAPVASTTDAVNQSVYMVTQSHKATLLTRVLQNDNVERTLIFTRTKHGADKLVKVLNRAGIHSEAIHGNKNQNARTRALNAFKSGRVPVLVATDIASRGIDVDEITHVINYDMPNAAESYVHRIGRTARAGATGFAISFCDYHEINDLRSIERMIKKPLEVMKDEPDLVYDAPTYQRKPRRQNSQGKSKFGGHGSRGKSGGRRSSGASGASGTSKSSSTPGSSGSSGKWRSKSKSKSKSAKPAAGYKPRKQR